jgi:hypothetical protein
MARVPLEEVMRESGMDSAAAAMASKVLKELCRVASGYAVARTFEIAVTPTVEGRTCDRKVRTTVGERLL